LPEELKLLYRTLNSFHETNSEKKDLHLLDLSNLFFANSPKDKEFYEDVFNTLEKYDPNLDTVRELIKSIRKAKVLRELSISAYEVAEGRAELSKVLQQVQELQDTDASTSDEASDETIFVTNDLEQLANASVKQPGIKFRLGLLRRSLGSLRQGDFGFVFARPETGKTTFLASEVSYFIDQVPESNPIIWFNNEEQGDKVHLRVYQAYFGITLEELLSNIPKYNKLFQEQTKGRFKLVDRATLTKREVESIVKKYKPSLILFDQIDKIKGFDADREDLVLGAIYQWAREIAKQYCPVIGICQADGTGENVRFLTMANVANAKTAKQAEADWILGIGTIHDTGWESIRFFHLSKNKLMGDDETDPKLRHLKDQCLIKPEIARYEDLQ
jgi:replicative DNA helicase